MNSDNIIKVLHSIQDVQLDTEGQLQVKFKDPDPIWIDGWEPVVGYIHGSFTEQLLLLIEEALQENNNPSPNGRHGLGGLYSVKIKE